MAMTDIKKLLVYVKAKEGQSVEALKSQVLTLSGTTLNDRVFFMADTDEIITHNHTFGVSEETKKHLANLDEAIKKTTGVDLKAGDAYEIVDDVTASTIAAYVAKKMTTVSAKDGSVATVTASTADAHTNYEVDVVVDGLTVVNNAGKLTSGLQLVYANKQATVEGIEAGHPSMYLADNTGAIFGNAVDVNDFIVDGMIEKVEYVVDDTVGPAIKFTWNTDGASQETLIPLSTVFKLEQIHTGTENYLSVKTTTPTGTDNPHQGDAEGGICYEVNANVNGVDLTVATSVEHIEADDDHNIPESYAAKTVSGAAANNFADVKNELADAKIVAEKFKATDELIAAVANRAIERDDAIGADIDEKIQEVKDSIDDLQAQVDEINSDSEDLTAHPTSVTAKIAALRDSLKVDALSADVKVGENTIMSVELSQEAGKIKDLKLEAKLDSLMSETKLDGIDGQVKVGDTTYYIKDIDTIAKTHPSLVTVQDAWLYGKALMTTVKSDNSEYIKVDNVDGKLQIVYEPWAEVHSTDELEALYGAK